MAGAHRRWFPTQSVRLILMSLAALSLTASLSSCGKTGKAGGRNKGLVGRWESADRSQGAIGNTIEMTADNRVFYTVGAMVDGKYTIAGAQLTVALGDTVDERQSRVTGFRVNGDTLTVIPTGAPAGQALIRSGKRASGSPVAGTWTYSHPAGAAAYEAYAPGGAFHFRLPLQTIEGTYAVTADSVELRLTNAPVRKAAFKLENGMLTLTDAEGHAVQYAAADAVLSPESARAPTPPPGMMAPPPGPPPAQQPPTAEQPGAGQ